MSLSVAPFAGCDGGGEPTVKLDPISATVDTWSAPESFGRNNNFKVEVSEDGEQWTELAVYNVKPHTPPTRNSMVLSHLSKNACGKWSRRFNIIYCISTD